MNKEKELEQLGEKMLSSETVFDGVLLHVVRDRVELPNGNESGRELIRHVGAVGVIPVTDDKKVIVERQFRYPIGKVITEIPAGKVDGPEEDRLEACKRELREETGITAREWICIGDYYPTPAYSDERITLYLARGLEEGERNLDEDEFLNVSAVPLEELVEEVMAGEIADGKTQTAILKAARILAAEDSPVPAGK